MHQNGVNVSELQTQLLQKIEELTLYILQQEKTIQELKAIGKPFVVLVNSQKPYSQETKQLVEELKKRGIEHCKVVYSKEEAIKRETDERKPVPGSIAFVPSVAGLIIASEVVKDLIQWNNMKSKVMSPNDLRWGAPVIPDLMRSRGRLWAMI